MRSLQNLKIGFFMWILCGFSVCFLIRTPQEQLEPLGLQINTITPSDALLYIDDSDPKYSWEKVCLENPYVSNIGDGVNFYMINYGIFEANGMKHCIVIKNSNDQFTIEKCILNSTSYMKMSSAIYFENISSGHILSCNILQNGNFGIYAVNCGRVIVWRSKVSHNNGTGIYFKNVDRGLILENSIDHHKRNGIILSNCSGTDCARNNVSNCDHYGISLNNSDKNNVEVNRIFSNNHGISVSYSSNNLISMNNISDNSGNAIILNFYSHFNDITNNTFDNGNNSCITIGTSCRNLFLKYNTPCNTSYYEDIPESTHKPDYISGYNMYWIIIISLICFSIIIISIIDKKKYL